MKVSITNDWIYLDCSDFVGNDLGAVWVKSKKLWRLPNTIGALKEIMAQGHQDPEYMNYVKLKMEKRQKHIDFKKVKGNERIRVQPDLRPYQAVDAAYINQLPHAGVFNEMRTGKTPTTLTAVMLDGYEKTIVVCPASLVLNWAQEVERWTHHRAYPIRGTKKKRLVNYNEFLNDPFPSILIVSVGTLVQDYHDFVKPKEFCLVVDEAHYLRNTKSKQTKITKVLGDLATKRYALTGTPAMNHGSDVFGLLSFLYPTRYRAYTQFAERYFNTSDGHFGGTYISKRNPYKRKEELQEILDLISIQRKRKEVMSWIPDKQYQRIPLEMPAAQQKVYNDMLEMFEIEEDNELVVDAPSVLAQLTRLRQISLDPALLGVKAPSAKTTFIKEWIEANPDEQLVIFTNFTSYFEILKPFLQKSKIKFGEISGNIPTKDRQKFVDSFQLGKTQVLLCNIQAAGVGLTLDASSTVIFLDRNYVPALNDQAEDRIVPTTENSNMDCLIIDLVASPIDAKINQVLGDKVDITRAVNDYGFMRKLLEK